MVFDVHDRAFDFFKGTCRRGFYDNMTTAVETAFIGKERLSVEKDAPSGAERCVTRYSAIIVTHARPP
jgi:transposase